MSEPIKALPGYAPLSKWRAEAAEARAETAETALADAKAERDAAIEALKAIAFLRPLGPCRNKLVEQIERIALNALELVKRKNSNVDV